MGIGTKIIDSFFLSSFFVGVIYLSFIVYFKIKNQQFNTKPKTMYDKFLYYTFANMYTQIFMFLVFVIISMPLIFGLQSIF